MSKKFKSNNAKFEYSDFTKSTIFHVISADRATNKAYSLLNRPNSKEYHNAYKKSIYHEKIASWQLENKEVAPKRVKIYIWKSIE